MEKIGLKRNLNGNFAHSKLAADHKLSHHVLYRLSSGEYILPWRKRSKVLTK
jgi:hypothetical protein